MGRGEQKTYFSIRKALLLTERCFFDTHFSPLHLHSSYTPPVPGSIVNDGMMVLPGHTIQKGLILVAKGKFEYWLSPEGLTLLQGWARDGLTDVQIAHNMGICRDTLNEWKNRFPAISDTLKTSKEIADLEVENALYKSALGYDIEESRTEIDDKGHERIIRTVRHIPPSNTAQIFWLKNRKPQQWRDHPNVEADAVALEKLDALLGEFKNAVESETT